MDQRDTTLAEIAAKHLHLETLETRNSDSLDFHDMAVWSIKAGPGSRLRGRPAEPPAGPDAAPGRKVARWSP